MGTISVFIPEELEQSLHKFKFNWEEVARKAIFDKAEKLKKLKRLSSKIKVSDKVAKEFSDKISKSVAKRFHEAE